MNVVHVCPEAMMQELTDEQKQKELDTLELARIRTRLANRRTFLAWCRTALSFMAFAFVLERLNEFLSMHHRVPDVAIKGLGTLGEIAFVGAPFFVLFAGFRYVRIERKLGMDGFDKFIMPEILMVSAILAAVLVFMFS